MHKLNEAQNSAAPVKKRFLVLDLLRGFALLGIIMANFPEFSLWTFQPQSTLAAMQSARADNIVQWILYIFVDGKFYTLFSLLFGIGFSIIIANCNARGASGRLVFYRRMIVLVLIGLAHLLLLWSGDILLLYALMGMLLPLFWRCSDKGLLRWAALFLFLPVAIDSIRVTTGLSFATLPYNAWWAKCGEYGITEENFGTWLRDSEGYAGVHQFLMQGAWERLWEFVEGNRYFKVLGLFLLGLYVGRKRLYADLDRWHGLIRSVCVLGICIGLPLTLFYAWSAMNGHPWGKVAHTVLYTLSVYPLGFAYTSGLVLLYQRWRRLWVWKALALPGRMALTNYLFQSIAGIVLFYGIGFAQGASTSLVGTEMIAVVVYIVQLIISGFWLRFFQFGPTEWVWRMLTYRKYFKLLKNSNTSQTFLL